MYLLPAGSGLFMFVQTRDTDLIKKIDSSSIAVADIQQILKANESIGFSSYVYFDSCWLGFGFTVMSPRSSIFTNFINQIFAKCGLSDYQFHLTALVGSVSKDEALKYTHFGTTFIQFSNQSSFWNDLKTTFGADDNDFSDLDTIQVILKPKPRKDLSYTTRALIKNVPNDDVEKFIVKAKGHLGDQLVDLYIEGKGQLFDTLNIKDEADFSNKIKQNVQKNKALRKKVAEYETDPAFSKDPLVDLAEWCAGSKWPGVFDGFQIP